MELENSYVLLDRWKNKSDELLYSMIPQTVADRLRAGANSLSTCEVRGEISGSGNRLFAIITRLYFLHSLSSR